MEYYSVDSCPQNITAVLASSSRLGCGQDKYGNDQYICVPNTEKTSLIELCYNGIMGMKERSHCLEINGEKLHQIDCLGFSSGCPETEFRSNKIYEYPACQSINTQHNCYLAEPSCPNTTGEVTAKDTTEISTLGLSTNLSFYNTTTTSLQESTPPQDKDNYTAVVVLSLVGVVFIIVLLVFAIILWKKKFRKKKREQELTSAEGEMFLPENGKESFELDNELQQDTITTQYQGEIDISTAPSYERPLPLKEDKNVDGTGKVQETGVNIGQEERVHDVTEAGGIDGTTETDSASQTIPSRITVDEATIKESGIGDINKQEQNENEDKDEAHANNTLTVPEPEGSPLTTSEDTLKKHETVENSVPKKREFGVRVADVNDSDTGSLLKRPTERISRARRALIQHFFGVYKMWKTKLSDEFSTLTDDEVSVLFCFLCSDSGPPDLTDTEWLDMLKLIRQKGYHKEDPVTSEEAQQTLDRLKSRDFLWKDQDKIHITDDAKDETMYRIALKCKILPFSVPFYLSSYDTATRYLRSSSYTRKNGEKCVIGNKIFHSCDSLLILRLQMNMLTHVTIEDTHIFKLLVKLMNTPDNKMKGNQHEREQFIKDLKKTGEAVHYSGRSQDRVQHVKWLWRYRKHARPDIVRSCIGLHPHWDIYIIDNKAYRQPSRYHKYPEEDRSPLYCLLFCDKYTGNVKEESFKSLLKKIREKYFPKLAPSDNADFTRRQCDVKETQNGVMTFASDKIRHDVMYAFVTECLMKDSDLKFFLTTASRDVISEHCRSWEYERSEGERCLYVPERPEKMYNLFIDKLQLDIITHCTVSDWGIHDSISERLKIPREILSWDQKARERYIQYAERGGLQTIHHARGMIVGCAGAGKTTLLHRLLKRSQKEIKDLKSTKGLEVHEEIFEICERKKTLKVKKKEKKSNKDRSDTKPHTGCKKTLSFFDFGGQCAYYPCHQIYLTRRAFYVVVVDASKDLSQIVDQTVCDQAETVFANWTYGDYFLFWMKSIHTYCYLHNNKENDVIIVLVATHWDKSVYKDKTYFLDGLQSVLPANSNLVQYITEDRCFCTNLLSGQIKDLKKFIVQIAAKEKWSEKIPHEWVFFEDKIKKEKHRRVLNLKDITRDLRQHGDEEKVLDLVNDMLRYYHDAGKILHFNINYLSQSVIIDVQWFVDAFKVIITDRNHVRGINARREDWEEFYKTGYLSDSLLSAIWELEDAKMAETHARCSSSANTQFDNDPRSLQHHKTELLLYMKRLGLISSEGQLRYVPSMNKKDFGERQKEQIKGANSKSSVLVFLFDFLPYFFFYRLVTRLMEIKDWEVLKDDGTSCLYKNAAFFRHESHKVAIAVTPSTIQLQIFQSNSETLLLPVTLFIRKTVEEILQDLTKSFLQHLKYDVGFFCNRGDAQILGEDITQNFVEEYKLKPGSEMACPLHEMENDHKINPEYLTAYWKQAPNVPVSSQKFLRN